MPPFSSSRRRSAASLGLAVLPAQEIVASRSRRASAPRRQAERRRGRPQGQDEGRARDAEEGAAARGDYLYDLPWYVLIGPPGAGQDHGAGQLRPEVSAVARRNAGGGRRRRRHALLRLVVHRRRGADRHRRPLHHAGFRRQGGQAELARVSRPAEEEPAAPADQRRAGRDQSRRPDDAEHARRSTRTPNAIRARLLELHDRLKVDFPVYALFTKADLVAGFMEYLRRSWTRTAASRSGARRSRPTTRRATSSARSRSSSTR